MPGCAVVGICFIGYDDIDVRNVFCKLSKFYCEELIVVFTSINNIAVPF